MLDLFDPLETAFRGIAKDLAEWFAQYPPDVPWTVVSDYCLGDLGKKNDVISFSIIANHDTTANICAYIAAAAPKDIKNTRTVPTGLMQYLNLPVTFSVSFVVSRDSHLLRDYIAVENMDDFLPDVEAFLRSVQANFPVRNAYFDDVAKRLRLFKRDIEANRQFNARLARQVFLVATFGAQVFKHLAVAKRPSHIRWISDRDAILDRYDSLVYDLSYVIFLLFYSTALGLPDGGAPHMIDKPEFIFEIPEKSGRHRYDELVRLPDYLAGTLADIDLSTLAFTHEKFAEVWRSAFVRSPNNSVVQVLGNAERVTVRRIGFG
jgi:hypothetical protein